ncbi:insulinase family protein, partial [Myxococcota bacterium]|nr:insulinase family protein [Myxococcota bacterium]
MKTRIIQISMAIFALTSAMACSHTTTPKAGLDPDHSFRASAPKAGPTPELNIPVAAEAILENGLKIFVQQKPNLPLVTIGLVFKRGSASDPVGKEGLARVVGDFLRAGTTELSATDFAEKIETLGSSLRIRVREDSTVLAVTMTKDNLVTIFNLMSDAILKPALAPDELERIRRKRLASLLQEKDNPRSIVGRHFRKEIYGAHPYGHPASGNEAGLKAITQEDVQEFIRLNLTPQNAAIIFAGAITLDEAREMTQRQFGSWERTADEATSISSPQKRVPLRLVINRADAPQSQLKVGHPGIARETPDYLALVLCNTVLGGSFNSRINYNLREEKGYTYGARSSFSFLRHGGSFVVSTGVRSDSTIASLSEIFKEVEKMKQKGVSEDELNLAKSTYRFSLPGYFQTIYSMASMMSKLFIYDLPLDYYKTLPAQVEKISTDDILKVAKKYLHPEELSII